MKINTKEGNLENVKVIGVLIIGSILTYFIVKTLKGVYAVGEKTVDTVKDTTDRFGITGSDEAKVLKDLKCLSMNYYTGKEPPSRDYSFFFDLAQKIYDAKTGSFYTDDDKILGAFKTLSSKKDVSYLARVFFYRFDKDLLNYFYSPMQDSYLKQIYNFINSLPS